MHSTSQPETHKDIDKLIAAWDRWQDTADTRARAAVAVNVLLLVLTPWALVNFGLRGLLPEAIAAISFGGFSVLLWNPIGRTRAIIAISKSDDSRALRPMLEAIAARFGPGRDVAITAIADRLPSLGVKLQGALTHRQLLGLRRGLRSRNVAVLLSAFKLVGEFDDETAIPRVRRAASRSHSAEHGAQIRAAALACERRIEERRKRSESSELARAF